MPDARRPQKAQTHSRTISSGVGSGTWFSFKPVRASRPYEVAVEQIIDAVRSGSLRVGDKLPSERVLAEQMEISRPTLREGIRVLTVAGVLEVRRGPGGGTFVRSEAVPPDLSSAQMTLRISDVSAVLEARRMLEPRVAVLAALHATERDFHAMREAVEALRSVGTDRDRLVQVDMRFHLMVARATQNEMVVELVRVLFQRLEMVRHLVRNLDGEPGRTIALHQSTLKAIMAGDPELIETVMDDHLAQLEQAWELETGRVFLRRIPDFLLPAAERLKRKAERPGQS